MAAVKFVWGYRAGIFVILAVLAGVAMASASSDLVIPAVEIAVGHR